MIEVEFVSLLNVCDGSPLNEISHSVSHAQWINSGSEWMSPKSGVSEGSLIVLIFLNAEVFLGKYLKGREVC